AISDATTGKLVATVPIGQGVDACRFDAGTGLAFASNGDGTLTVVHEDTPDKFTVVGNVPTKRGARTMELDEKSHRLFTVTADFGPPPAPTPERPRPRPSILPGTFALLVLDPERGDQIVASADRDEQRRHGEQRDRGRQREPADDGERERALQLAPRADPERE